MRGLNRVEIMGNLGLDPEMRYTPGGKSVTTFRVAVNRKWRGGDGQPQESVEWFRVVAWGALGETCNQYLTKGAPVYIDGRLQTRTYEAADGNTRYITEVVAREMILLPRGNGNGGNGRGGFAEDEGVEDQELAEVPVSAGDDDDIPF